MTTFTCLSLDELLLLAKLPPHAQVVQNIRLPISNDAVLQLQIPSVMVPCVHSVRIEAFFDQEEENALLTQYDVAVLPATTTVTLVLNVPVGAHVHVFLNNTLYAIVLV